MPQLNNTFRTTILATGLLALAANFLSPSPVAQAEDWPQWRGPNRDGVWKAEGIIQTLPSGQLETQWSVDVGPGYSGPTVCEGRVYITDRVEADRQERILCFDSATGKRIWLQQYESDYSIGYKAGPRASVTIDEGKAYAVGAMGHFHCLDAITGAIVWSRDLEQDYSINMPAWGIASSPLIYKNLVIQQVGGSDGTCMVAFDKQTGQEIWRALDERASYAAPIVIQQANKDVLVCWTGGSLTGLDAETGQSYWSHSMPPIKMPIGIGTPVYNNERIFVSSFYDGSLMVTAPRDSLTSQLVWRARGPDEQKTASNFVETASGTVSGSGPYGVHAMIGTSIVDGETIYAVDSYGEFRCLDANTGQRLWEDQSPVEKSRWATIHMVRHEDRIWMFNEAGELMIASLSPDGLTIHSRSQLLAPTRYQLNQRGGVCWSHPAYAERSIFARSDEKLIRVSLAAEQN